MRAVEIGKAVRVVWKVAGNPIEQQTDLGAMAGVDEELKVRRAAVSACRRIEAGRLIAPRAVERMFRDRQELEMREAHLLDVWDENLGHLAIRQNTIAFLRTSAPRAEMRLVNRHRPA